MNSSKRTIVLCCVLCLTAWIVVPAQTTYNRNDLWDSGDSSLNSGELANVTDNMWKYEGIIASSEPSPWSDHGLNGSNPWWDDAGESLTWTADGLNHLGDSYSGWALGAYVDFPHIYQEFLKHRTSSNAMLAKSRVAWVSPGAGTVSITGKLTFISVMEDPSNLTKEADWVIAKRVGSSYTILASGTKSVQCRADESDPLIENDLALGGFSGLSNISMQEGDEIIWTHYWLWQYSGNLLMADDEMDIQYTEGTSVDDWIIFD